MRKPDSEVDRKTLIFPCGLSQHKVQQTSGACNTLKIGKNKWYLLYCRTAGG
jgi:hypothetical protein